MPTISKVGTPSLSSVTPPQNNMIVGLHAGENIDAGDVCYIQSDGTVARSDGSAAHGIALINCPEGEAITLARHVNMRYGSGLTPGAAVYAGDNGSIEDEPNGSGSVGFVVDATRIHFHGSYGNGGGNGGGTDNVTENVGSEV